MWLCVCLLSGLLQVIFVYLGILDAILFYGLQVVRSQNLPRWMRHVIGRKGL